MTARLLTPASEYLPSVTTLLNYCTVEDAAKSPSPHLPARRRGRARSSQVVTDSTQAQDWLWSALFESLREGVILVSCNLQPLYQNTKAQELCRKLVEAESPLKRPSRSSHLPLIVSQACYRLTKLDALEYNSLLVECQSLGQTIRIHVRWLEADQHGAAVATDEQQKCILVFLENCTELLQEDLRVEREKYDLTDREAEISMLLRQEYTYHEIAKHLQISLNTVKTHVKNLYAKSVAMSSSIRFW